MSIKLGPPPVLISRKEVDTLYSILQAVVKALDILNVQYIVTGGTLLGAIRQHSILFCDDDIDIAILETTDGTSTYDLVAANLARLLGPKFSYTIRPWEGGDRIRSKQITSVFLDLFTIRKFNTLQDLTQLIGSKKNGQPQSQEYIDGIVSTITSSARRDTDTLGNLTPLFPMYQFNTRKAIEMWPKEVYREKEMFPLQRNLKFGPFDTINGPQTPVLLLKRAFGDDCFDVYYQSASHKQQQQPPPSSPPQNHSTTQDSTLKPLLQIGGTWEGGRKVPLLDEHYLPMQPTLRTARRPDDHNRILLTRYLKTQINKENIWLQPQNQTIYMDGVFDLFHVGHLEAIEQCASLGNRVIIGVTGDVDATGYKRAPIINEQARTAIISALRYVDKVICPCPLIVTEQFMKTEGIDLVVHGFANEADVLNQNEFFAYPMSIHKFQRIRYSLRTSTTEILNRIQTEEAQNTTPTSIASTSSVPPPPTTQSTMSTMSTQPTILERFIARSQSTQSTQSKTSTDFKTTYWPSGKRRYHGRRNNSAHRDTTTSNKSKKTTNPNWFGAAVAKITSNASSLPSYPFPPNLTNVVATHVSKATDRRQKALKAIRDATGSVIYDATMTSFAQGPAKEGTISYRHNIEAMVQVLLKSCNMPLTTELENLHLNPKSKDLMLYNLTKTTFPSTFQIHFDQFVRDVCVPKMAELCRQTIQKSQEGQKWKIVSPLDASESKTSSDASMDTMYYQAFPCLRIVRPDEFSIGPHADVSYGHHPCNVNFYIPLTSIQGTSSLYLESNINQEDWHPIQGQAGDIVHFAGATNLHWTTENKTSKTRVSLDVRVISSIDYHALKDGGDREGGQIDVYRRDPGYYQKCVLDADNKWQRVGPLLPPDARVGYPWTIKNWYKILPELFTKGNAKGK